MAPILRFIGLLNAAVWLGAMLFFTAIIGPAILGVEVKQLLPRGGEWLPGAIAQILVGRYLLLQQWCAGIALVHLVFEWLYTGKLGSKAPLFILIGCLGVSLAGTRLLMPQMKQLHLIKYAVQSTPAQKQAAQRNFSILHATAQIMNLLALSGVLFYYWRLSGAAQGARSGASSARYRS